VNERPGAELPVRRPAAAPIGRACLFIAELAVVVQDHVGGDIVGGLGLATGHGTELTDRNSNIGHLSPWNGMSYSNRVNGLKMPPS
jgi:hypothetical protein